MNSSTEVVEELKQECKSSLMAVCKLLDYKDVNWSTHERMIETLESKGQRKLICVPRGCLKSSIACVAYPIWRLINDPNDRILIDSQLYTNSKNFIREIRAHLDSQRFQLVFGDLSSGTWNEGELILKSRVKAYKEPSITAGGIGTVKVGQHYDAIVGDDYSSWDNCNNTERAQKVIDHYRYNLSILEPTGTYVIVGTRYSDNDAIGYIIENELEEAV